MSVGLAKKGDLCAAKLATYKVFIRLEKTDEKKYLTIVFNIFFFWKSIVFMISL